jgi:hypothetical protein
MLNKATAPDNILILGGTCAPAVIEVAAMPGANAMR